MADNVTLNSGSGGATLSTDEVTRATVVQHVQYVKLMNGTDAAIDVIPGEATNGLDVDVTRVQGTVIVGDGGSTISVDDGAGSLTVDNAALAVTGGGVEASALRVTIANDSTGVVSVDDNGSTLSVDDGAGSLTVDNAALSVTGGGVEASALRVTIANDSTGVVSVDDNGSSLTVDVGTALPAGDNNIGNVDIVTMPNVTLAAGTNTNEVVGDAAHDAAIAGNPVRIGGRALSSDYTPVAAGDTADLVTTLTGKQVVQPYALPGETWSYAAASGGITNTTGVTAKAVGAAGVRHYVTSAQVINGHATVSTDVQIRDGASGTVLHRGFAQAAGGGYAVKFDPPLRGTAATLIEVACGTTGSAVYVNLQGYSAAE